MKLESKLSVHGVLAVGAIFFILSSCISKSKKKPLPIDENNLSQGSSVDSPSMEDMLKHEIQNGDLMGFYATEDYCDYLLDSCEECLVLQEITEETNRVKKAVIFDEHVLLASRQLDSIFFDVGEWCGGFCVNTNWLPVLPYRNVDIQNYWSSGRRQKLMTLDLFSEELEQAKNTIEALVALRRLQLSFLKENKKSPLNTNSFELKKMAKTDS